MSLAEEIDNYPPEERERLVGLGQGYGSDSTRAQAERTLKAYERHKAELRGFTPKDAEELAEAAALLVDAGGARGSRQGEKKVTRKAFLEAVRESKRMRLEARTILSGAWRVLRKRGSEEAKAARLAISVVLAETGSAGADAGALARQLERLAEVHAAPAVAAAITARGEAPMNAELSARAASLRQASASRATTQGTPVESERVDLLDGIIVELTREARKAARAASARTGNKAIAEDFELSALYATS